MDTLLEEIRRCVICKEGLGCRPRPVVQLSSSSKIIIVGQAPGRRVHETGIPWNDASGKTLRAWLGIDESVFYNPEYFSIMPMGFCYPGKGKSGDLPPRRECAPLWHSRIMDLYSSKPLILLIGQYAQRYYLGKNYKSGLTETVRAYTDFLPQYFPLPHPSPRNRNWIKTNPWFEEGVIQDLREKIKDLLKLNL
ncbi:uracil-DNA glycosylase family protein [Desertivirga brevis]|uniref:uracil-DNA glycosylase family protein n=1 Tax=Desertivirga brevis TaxID=2810310 RepID=UPI001A96423F|nr:uracil-DNA glycosylase family protein [Pedobacter sp. SYSU D00873]